MDGGAFANGRMDAPLSDCGKKQTAERKALNSFPSPALNSYAKICVHSNTEEIHSCHYIKSGVDLAKVILNGGVVVWKVS